MTGRWEPIVLRRDCMATTVPRGEYVMLSEGGEVSIVQQLGGSITVRAELGSDALGDLMAFIRTQPALNTIPLVLLSDDASESRFLGQVKEGIVELLKLPFNTRLYGSRLRMSFRPGSELELA